MICYLRWLICYELYISQVNARCHPIFFQNSDKTRISDQGLPPNHTHPHKIERFVEECVSLISCLLLITDSEMMILK